MLLFRKRQSDTTKLVQVIISWVNLTVFTEAEFSSASQKQELQVFTISMLQFYSLPLGPTASNVSQGTGIVVQIHDPVTFFLHPEVKTYEKWYITCIYLYRKRELLT